jgi:hypothetical protein
VSRTRCHPPPRLSAYRTLGDPRKLATTRGYSLGTPRSAALQGGYRRRQYAVYAKACVITRDPMVYNFAFTRRFNSSHSRFPCPYPAATLQFQTFGPASQGLGSFRTSTVRYVFCIWGGGLKPNVRVIVSLYYIVCALPLFSVVNSATLLLVDRRTAHYELCQPLQNFSWASAPAARGRRRLLRGAPWNYIVIDTEALQTLVHKEDAARWTSSSAWASSRPS